MLYMRMLSGGGAAAALGLNRPSAAAAAGGGLGSAMTGGGGGVPTASTVDLSTALPSSAATDALTTTIATLNVRVRVCCWLGKGERGVRVRVMMAERPVHVHLFL